MRTVFIFLLAAVVVVIGASCGDDGNEGAPTVAATTGIAADLAERVSGGEIEVEQVIPDAVSPHDFELSAQERQTLEDAELIVSIGGGLEAGLPLEDVDTPQWALTDHVGELRPFEASAHDEDEHEAEEETGVDPHVWMDPTLVASALPSLAEELATTDPGAAASYSRNAEAYARELDRLDRELRRTLATIPLSDRELITSHDSLAYLAERYDLEVVATAFPASGPEAEASAGRLDEVLDAISEHDVPAVFAQAGDDPDTLRLIAGEAGVAIEEGLLVESPGAAGSYVEMLRRDAELIAAALGPARDPS